MPNNVTDNVIDNVTDNVSPLARRLADTHDVDLSALAKNPDDKITARSVLEHLSATEPARRRGEVSPTSGTGPNTEAITEAVSETASVAPSAQTESSGTVAEQPTVFPEQVPEASLAQAADPALERTRAQLQATVQVHQQAIMQVGSLRQRNNALEHETERLRAAEAQAQAELQRLAEQKAQLERDLERSKSGTFSWLKKLIS